MAKDWKKTPEHIPPGAEQIKLGIVQQQLDSNDPAITPEHRKVRAQTRSAAVLWAAAVLLTYVAGKFMVDLAKWVALAYMAPSAEAKLILAPYLAAALFPVLLPGLPAAWAWRRLLRRDDRAEVFAVLGLELAVLAYFDVSDLQVALANFVG